MAFKRTKKEQKLLWWLNAEKGVVIIPFVDSKDFSTPIEKRRS